MGSWTLRARATSPTVATVTAWGPGGAGWTFQERHPASRSSTEMLLHALSAGLRRLASKGATAVTVVFKDPVLDGYLHRGWRPRSIPVITALKAFVEATNGTRIEFASILRDGRRR